MPNHKMPGTLNRNSLRVALATAGAAGNHTVTGIKTTDTLVYVGLVVASTSSVDETDVTSEFTITAADTINNNGGTSSGTGSKLRVIYLSANS